MKYQEILKPIYKIIIGLFFIIFLFNINIKSSKANDMDFSMETPETESIKPLTDTDNKTQSSNDFSMETTDTEISSSKEKNNQKSIDYRHDITLLKINDINETYNRSIHSFNTFFILDVLGPVYLVYKQNSLLERAFLNFATNLNEPRYALNHLLQGNFHDFAGSMSRFILNTTFGLFGIFDVAKTGGVEVRRTSMADTMAVWGIPSGDYVVIPFLGPYTVRNTVGYVIDIFVDPLDFVMTKIFDVNWVSWFIISSGITGVRVFIDISYLNVMLTDIEKNSIDPASTMKNYYLQNQYHRIINLKKRIDKYSLSNREKRLQENQEGYKELSITGNLQDNVKEQTIQNPATITNDFSMEVIE